jgi:hypothetical protein
MLSKDFEGWLEGWKDWHLLLATFLGTVILIE